MQRRRGGFTLVEMMIVVAIVGTLAAVAVPSLLSSQRAAHERKAASSLRMIATAEQDFRANDRDGNRTFDYWTGDVAGLYGMTSAAVPGRTDPPLRLLDVSIAAADSAPLAAGAAGGEYRAIGDFSVQGPSAGYWFYALQRDLTASPVQAYRTDTQGTPSMGSVQNSRCFAFLAYPDQYKSSGRTVLAINETGSMIRRDPGRSIKARTTVPPGVPVSGNRDWPSFPTQKAQWGRAE